MIIRFGDEGFSEAWSRLMAQDPFCPPFFTETGIRLEIECHRHRGVTCEDRSFVVSHAGTPMLGMRVAAMTYGDAEPELSAYGHPVALLQNASCAIPAEAHSEMDKELSALFSAFAGMAFKYRELLSTGALSSVGHRILAAGAEGRARFTRVIDLHETNEALAADRRRRFKSSISWGQKNLSIEVMTAQNADAAVFEQCHQLHVAEAGRETRNAASWDLQFERINAGEAYVVLGRLEGELVSFGYYAHTAKWALYYSSASRRDLFEKPIYHAVLWQAVLHAKEIGCDCFEVGGLLFKGVGGSPKKDQISQFKSGFGGTSRAQCDFLLKIPETPTP